MRAIIPSLCAILMATLPATACDIAASVDGPEGTTDPYVRGRTTSAPLTVPSVASLSALQARYQAEGTTPEGALKVWFVGVFKYGSDNLDEYHDGRAALMDMSVDFEGDPDWETLPSYQTFVDRTTSKRYIFRSYAVGATPDNGYAMDPDDFELNVVKSEEDPFGDRGWAVHLESGGADSPRIVYMRKDDATGLWRAGSFDNVYVDVRAPE